MSTLDIRLPNITAPTESGQLSQMRSYIYQFAEQLNYALKQLEQKQSETEQYIDGQQHPTEDQTEKQAVTNFNSVKALIIKSADIVNAYYEEISKKLEGVYVAESDFGTFKQNVEAEFKETAENIEQNYYNKQEIDSQIESINEIIANAYIRSGLLGYDSATGAPIYGLEVGQTNTVDGVETFNKYARFTSDRLSFYDKNDTEVAYISDYILHITNAEISGSLTLGRYYIDTTNGLSFKWI